MPVLNSLALMARGGTRGRRLASSADLLWATGPTYARGRLRERAELRRLGREPRRAVYRAIWEDAARRIEATVTDFSHGYLELRRAGRTTRVREQAVMLDDGVTLALALDKPLVHKLLAEQGISVPRHVEFPFEDLLPAVSFMESEMGACVVKPAGGTGGGEGVVCGVRSSSDLTRATWRASRLTSRLLIERQVAGEVLRLLFLDGELLDVVLRKPPSVLGDGVSTLGDLIAEENRRRLAAGGGAGLALLRADLDAVLTLEAAGLDLRSVPSFGTAVRIKTATNESGPRDNATICEPLSPELVAEARRAAGAVGLRLAGVDVITPDCGRSLAESGGVINEVNGHPALHHHYQVVDPPAATRVAVPILRRLLGGEAGERCSVSGE